MKFTFDLTLMGASWWGFYTYLLPFLLENIEFNFAWAYVSAVACLAWPAAAALYMVARHPWLVRG